MCSGTRCFDADAIKVTAMRGWHGWRRCGVHSWAVLPSGRQVALASAPSSARRLSTAAGLAPLLPAPSQYDILSRVDEIPTERVRNFSIISHVDHGKSTLADRMLEMTGAVVPGEQMAQSLDSLEVERARGITIKAQTVSLLHEDEEGKHWLLNLIDTPGHVDFSYEVSRSLAACQGALLLVDATKGVQAQTVANFWLAFEQGIEIIPVINKTDLPHADVQGSIAQMTAVFDVEAGQALLISAKTGAGTSAIIPAILARTPPPSGDRHGPLRVMLLDSWYDDYRGVLCAVQVVSGTLHTGQPLLSSASRKTYNAVTMELMRPGRPISVQRLAAGQVACVMLGMKTIQEAHVGDTLSSPDAPQPPLPGFQRPQPMVFAGMYPLDGEGFDELQHAMSRFLLKDGSVTVEHEHSPTLGRGLRCGFLGLLHLEVVQQRLQAEHGVGVLLTSPTVPLLATLNDGTQLRVNSPETLDQLKTSNQLRVVTEPLVKVTLLTPSSFVGPLISLCESHGGSLITQSFLSADRAMLQYNLPLAEIATDFHDRVKTLSSGYASFDYEPAGTQVADVVALGLHVNKRPVGALTRIVRASKAQDIGRQMVEVLAEEMDRAVYDIIVQATVGSKVVARQTIRAVRKNVLAKCYGGDISRKKKLLEKQKDGKKRRALSVGDVAIPHEAFVKVLAPNSGKKKR